MGGYRAEIAAAETSPVRDDGILDHIVRRDALAFVSRMRTFGERQVPERIHLLLRRRRIRRVDLDEPVGDRLDYDLLVEHVGVGLYLMEILRESAVVLQALFVGMEHERVVHAPLPLAEECELGDFLHLPEIASGLDGPRQFKHRPLAHAVAQPVGSAVQQDGAHQAVVPIVIVGQAAERSLHSPDDDRDIRPEFLQDTGVDGDGPVRTLPGLAVRGIGVIVAQTLGGRVVVDHRVHRPGVDGKVETRRAELAEITQVITPVRLGDDGHPVAELLKVSRYARGTETRMIHKGVTREEDDVYVVPSESTDLLDGSRNITFCQAVQFPVFPFRRGAPQPCQI